MPSRPGVRALWLLAAAAAVSSAAALPLQFVGEEGILAITSLEMWHRKDWLRLWLFGIDHQHGVFANWLIIPAAAAIGWEHVLAVTRGVMIAATAASGALAAFLAHRLWRDAGFAVFAGAVYLTFGDVLLYRGWLGYRDPLFGFLVFAAIAGLWLGARERRTAWLVASAVAVSAAFLTKGIIAYVFVGTAALVLLFHPAYRAFLLRPASIAVAIGCAAALAWWLFGVHGDRGQGMRMTSEILAKLEPESVRAYLVKLAAFPLEVMLRLAPVSLLAAWLLARTAPLRAQWLGDPDVRTALAIAALCALPYWLAPHWHIRYLAPVLPLVAMTLAAALWFADGRHLHNAMRWMWAAVALKLVLLLAVFPHYQQVYRGENFEVAARDIVARTAGHPLYSTNVAASGLSVAAHIDLMRLPAPPIDYAPSAWNDGFVITYAEKDTAGRVVARYRFGGTELFLLCRGSACPSGAAQP